MAHEALQLIKELEEKQPEEFNSQLHELELRLEALQCDERLDRASTHLPEGWVSCIHVEGTSHMSVYQGLPIDVLEKMGKGFDPSKGWEYLKGLPLSRKQRKRLMNSTSWVVHLYSSEVDNTSYFRESLKGDRVLLEIDITKSKAWNLNQKPPVYHALLWAECQGKIDSVLGGPLWSRPAEGFPPPQMWLWTLASLSPSVLLSGASVAIALCRDLVGLLLEHPEDPQRYRKQTPEVQSCPSLWRTIMWKEFRDAFFLDALQLDQGAVGHITVKPTTPATFELSQRRHSMNTFISDLFLNPGFDSESDSDLQSDLEFDYFLNLRVILICKVIWSRTISDSESDLEFDYFLTLKVMLDDEVIFKVISHAWSWRPRSLQGESPAKQHHPEGTVLLQLQY